MAAVVHLEGMGILGSILAWNLDKRGVSFTWSDVGLDVNAWKASTGIVYPSGNDDETQCYNQWVSWYQEPPWGEEINKRSVEASAYWFTHKNPPHSGKDKIVCDLKQVRMSARPSYHLNAQHFVPDTRRHFAARRTAGRSEGERLIISHGFNNRLGRYLWGWTVRVKLAFSDELLAASNGLRPNVYGKLGRFVFAYAYTIPGTPYWYAGSNLINQKTAKPLDGEKHFKRWLHDFRRTMSPHIKVSAREEGFLQGWRPVAADGDNLRTHVNDAGAIVCPPLWSSGIRMSPQVVADTMEILGV